MIIPTENRLILQKIKEDEKPNKGVLILPDNRPKQDRYRVVGPYPTNVAYADTAVYIEKYKGIEIVKDGETYIVIKQEDIIAYDAEEAE